MDRQQRNVWFFSMYDIPLTMFAMQKVEFGCSWVWCLSAFCQCLRSACQSAHRTDVFSG